MTQEKLIQTQKKHEEILMAEREEMVRNFENMKKQLVEEMAAENNPDILLTEATSSESDKDEVNSKENGDLLLDFEGPKSVSKAMAKTPKMSPFNKRRSTLASVPVVVSPLTTSSNSPAPLSPRRLEKKTIDSLGLESKHTMPAYSQTPRRSLDGKLLYATPSKPNEDKLTITQLVENNLHNPGTMALIRKELKADGLTPKIERKFHKQELPAVKKDIVHPLQKTSPPMEMEGKRKKQNGRNGSDI